MKKTFIACGAALACLGAAHAQSNVQVTGLADAFVGSMKLAGQDRTNQVGSGGMTTSWWGVQGTEDLGSGLKVGFNLGAFFRLDEGTPGRFNGDTFFARDANVWLGGSFGTVRLGRSMAPNFLPTILFNPFGDSFTVSPLVLHGNTPWPSFAQDYRTTAADTGWSNQITYTTPQFGGLTANVHYQFGEKAEASSKKNVAANLLYQQGALGLTAFIERAQVNNPSLALLPYTKQNWMLGGSYDLSVAKLFATYGQSKNRNSDTYEGKTFSLGVDVPVSKAGSIKAAFAQTKVEARDVNGGPLVFDGKRSTTSIGYDHNLSKRTDVYGVVMNDRVTGLKAGTSVIAGIRHRF